MVALAGAANIENGKPVMIKSPFGDSAIILLFIHHKFDEITILIGIGVGKSRKIIDLSASLFWYQKYNVSAAVHAFSGNMCIVFFGNVIKVM